MDEALLAATRELLVEVGYAALSFEAVATRAGVGRPAIYRRFPTKPALVHAAVFPDALAVTVPSTGDLENDVRTAVRRTVRLFTRPDVRAATPGLLAEMYADPELRATLRARIQAPTTAAWKDLLGADAEVLVEMLAGAVIFRVATRGRCGPAFERRLGDVLLAGLGTTTSG